MSMLCFTMLCSTISIYKYRMYLHMYIYLCHLHIPEDEDKMKKTQYFLFFFFSDGYTAKYMDVASYVYLSIYNIRTIFEYTYIYPDILGWICCCWNGEG